MTVEFLVRVKEEAHDNRSVIYSGQFTFHGVLLRQKRRIDLNNEHFVSKNMVQRQRK